MYGGFPASMDHKERCLKGRGDSTHVSRTWNACDRLGWEGCRGSEHNQNGDAVGGSAPLPPHPARSREGSYPPSEGGKGVPSSFFVIFFRGRVKGDTHATPRMATTASREKALCHAFTIKTRLQRPRETRYSSYQSSCFLIDVHQRNQPIHWCSWRAHMPILSNFLVLA